MALYLSKDSLDWAINHAVTLGDTDVFPPAFEFQAFHYAWPTLQGSLAALDIHARDTRPHRQALSPKGRFGFRIATQLDPLDFLIFAALVYEIGNDPEARRVSTDDGVVFSARFKPGADGAMSATDIGYSQFQERSVDLTNSGL